MAALQTGQLGASQLLGQVLADLSAGEQEEISVGPITSITNGVTAHVRTPKDEWRIEIEWVGDNESTKGPHES